MAADSTRLSGAVKKRIASLPSAEYSPATYYSAEAETMTANVLPIKRAPVAKRSTMDTLELNQRMLRTWLLPPFQRPLRVNEKVRAIADDIKVSGVVPGVITIGVIKSGPTAGTYIIDGQHRMHALDMSQIDHAYADVRIVEFDNLAEMGQEFVELNSQIVRMRPDDVLRGIEGSMPILQQIRGSCPYVGYDNIRRGPSNPILSMSMMLRVWAGSGMDTPVCGSTSSLHVAQSFTTDEATRMCTFLNVAFAAWGRGEDVQRMWAALNLGLSAWLWRRIVLDTDRSGQKRAMVLKPGQFQKCLMSLAANELYADWLVGRSLSDRDRSPAYQRIRTLFTARLKSDAFTGPVRFPSAAWASGSGS